MWLLGTSTLCSVDTQEKLIINFELIFSKNITYIKLAKWKLTSISRYFDKDKEM